ncbi:sulfatase-like hydrolase/transferase [Pseudomonas putida]|uniref:Sulfatase-like hydrolase/transferase n=1 Tax=Pseudomonas putida TaxID=303 RepID=A0A7W2QHN6_PSEPU|nr:MULTISPECIES: LTA synthase family protein [Pseudomonas]MBA6114639.1 sulfatase-like hydrolase/transferase [Pseudomonas putida]MBI6941280.1 sulfatase-like hydrolase/transferase [Pseudomonas putida]MBI6957651.1 sulfatase-like hydrolase/transferase [Pseudomonas putida]MCZ9638871.1 LTA synthase family protein [Pseudomonas putida]MEC4875733.1 LTA synthase family protein [Pseudomonas sp. NC26]
MRTTLTAPWRYLLLLCSLWFGIFLLTRFILLVTHLDEVSGNYFALFFDGALYDLSFLVYAALPMGLYMALCPTVLWRSQAHRWLLGGVLVVSLFVMLFVAVAEWLFWDEFGVRFNFIAVDYLVYSKEVLDNIRESYPLPALLGGIALVAGLLAMLLRRPLAQALAAPGPQLRQRLVGITLLAVLAGLNALVIDQQFPRGQGGNAYQRELASNGPYQFFAAFRNNELDYTQFYASLDAAEVGAQMHQELAEPDAHFQGKEPQDIRRHVIANGPQRTPNIILVTIESFSAKYMGSNGEPRNLTPNLDALRRQSLYFNNFYATGTRTDRGLEAITLSIPPTPGRSIVKRIGRESGYASLGQQLSAKGYDAVFVYGGRGYFDNMNAFFSGNGYRIVDQSSIDESEISFKNAWGIADEDLYRQTLKLADADHAKQKPFFLQLMTTSNHRPYTYPDGRIDIPSGEGREGAVKYTDHAIAQFLEAAKGKPWFDNTLFIFVADHTAGSAGVEDLPVQNYQIPLFIYAPKLIEAREESKLASQIDLAPTLLGLLGMSYTSTFFGRDLLMQDDLAPRVVIGNYQHLGLFDGTNLAILSPRGAMRVHEDALGKSRETTVGNDNPLVRRAIAYYQSAAYGFSQGLLAWKPEDAGVAVSP